MVISDRIYGRVIITSDVIVELLHSAPMQRLKGICQYGVPDAYYHHKGYSRYEHSVGVMLLLKRLGATEEEQIAGLLHDVSHTAFSHVVDWVIGEGGAEGYQDEQHEQYARASEIPRILKRHGYSIDRVIDYHHFGLLERDAPDLCADRVDYSLREFPASVVKTCLATLAAVNGRIVFTDKAAAALFAKHFLIQQMEFWGGFESIARYRIFADVLRTSLAEGAITMDDFWQDDDFVMRKIMASASPEVQHTLHVLESDSLANLDKSDVVVHKKFRHVDPHFVSDGEVVRLKDINQGFARELEVARRINQRGIAVPLLPAYESPAPTDG